MKTSWSWALALVLAMPVYAQEESAAEVVPADEPAAEPAAEEAAPVEEATAEEAPTEEAPAEASEPLALYFGVDAVTSTLSLSGTGAAGTSEFDSGMYRARLGVRALDAVGIELHYGIDNSDNEPGSVETKSYYGVFVVPTATVFEVVELAFPVGYAQSSFGSGSANEDFRSIAYGIDAELPIRSFADSLPDLRLTAGWMVYYQKSDGRAYGANLGLRYDFSFGGAGAPAEAPAE